jgi:hypothetical protein
MAASILQMKARLLKVRPASRLETLSTAEIDRIRSSFPGIPEDYLEFLGVVGYGRIGLSDFMVYSGPVHPDEIYDPPTAESLGGIVLVGDNFSGDCVGYDTKSDWGIGEIDSSNEFQALYGGITTFIEMVADRFLTDA